MAVQSSQKESTESGRLIVFTDLDATLLDHETYSWKPAQSAIDGLRQNAYPLILCSSKTLAEMVELAAELDTQAPLVAENGAFIAIPLGHSLSENASSAERFGDYSIQLQGVSRDHILEAAHALRSKHGFLFEGFSDWSTDTLVEHTGLSTESAERASQRLATEPILWNDKADRFESFESMLAQHDIQAIRGGRFIHLMGKTDKARGVERLVELYRAEYPEISWTSVALGDSPNDLGMLSQADIAVVIPNPNRKEELAPSSHHVIRAPHPGPRGWNQVICGLLQSSTNHDVGTKDDG